MKALPAVLPIVLTPAEQRLADRIAFDARRIEIEQLRQSCGAAAQLARSLFGRDAIPEVRMQYFIDPEFNPGCRKSRYQVFRDNGRSDGEILEDGNFLRHLSYMIYGPRLPASSIAGFRLILEEDIGSTGMIQDQLRAFARSEIRTRGLDRHAAAEAFFMLTLECGEDLGLAGSVRAAVLSVRN